MKILSLTYCGTSEKRPQEVMAVVKPDTALLNGNKPFFVPHFATSVTASARIALRIGKMGRNIGEKFAMRYLDGIGIGIDIVAANMLDEARQHGLPWSQACGFDGSAPISAMMPIDENSERYRVCMCINGEEVQQTCAERHQMAAAVALASRFFTLHTGDVLLCPTECPPNELTINDCIEASINGEKIMRFNIK